MYILPYPHLTCGTTPGMLLSDTSHNSRNCSHSKSSGLKSLKEQRKTSDPLQFPQHKANSLPSKTIHHN